MHKPFSDPTMFFPPVFPHMISPNYFTESYWANTTIHIPNHYTIIFLPTIIMSIHFPNDGEDKCSTCKNVDLPPWVPPSY